MAAPTLADRVRAALRRRRSTGTTGRLAEALGSTQSPGRAPAGQLPTSRRPLLALPAPPGAEAGPVCPACRYRHPPARRLLTWSTPIDRILDGRPGPLREQAADVSSLDRDRFNPWRF